MEYDYYPEEEKKGGRFSAKRILTCVVVALIIVVYVLIIFRIIIKEDPKFAKSFVWTEAAVEAYESEGDSFKVMNQQIRSGTFTSTDENGKTVSERVTYNTISRDGYFQVNNFMYIEATKELIITFRYNDASIKALKEQYKDVEAEPYFLALSTSDGYVTDYSYLSSSRFTYEYRRVVFSGVDLSNESYIDINIYRMQENIDLSDPLTTLPVYDSRIPVEYYDISDALPAKANDLEKAPYVAAE